MREIILQTNSLSKEYPTARAVDNVNMTIYRGDVYGFIGQNGAGKTTMLRLITALIAPSAGEISLFNKIDRDGLEQGRKRIGCIVEGPVFFPKLSAEENLEYYRIQRGIPEKDVIGKALETVHLVGTGKKQYQQFSLGMKQRLGLALAIMGNPDFLILDEPINGLDPTGIVEFRSIISDLNRKRNMTILISSHILTELSLVATRYGIIHGGQLVRELRHDELEEDTKRYIAIRTDDVAKATVVLEQVLQTHNYEVVPGGELRVYVYIQNPSEVTFQLSTNGIHVASITERGTDLERYFLNIIDNNGKENLS